MTNGEWLDYLAHNAPDELSAWFDAEHVETEEQALDGDTEPENGDSRERLEAEIESYSAFDMMDTITLDMVIGWLDRQAAITERKLDADFEAACNSCATKIDLREEVDELTAERDKLQEQLLIGWEYECKFQAERDKFKEANNYHAAQYELASEDCDRLQAQVDELTAERVKLRSQICNLEDDLVRTSDERDNWKANCEDWKKDCERYREKFGKCLDYADAIHALMDEGMA